MIAKHATIAVEFYSHDVNCLILSKLLILYRSFSPDVLFYILYTRICFSDWPVVL